MQGILYENASPWVFIFVTCVLGGWTAWRTGKACAQTWKSALLLAGYLALLAVGVRFVHFSIFGETMFSLHYYIVDAVFLLIIGFIGFRYTRTNQMVSQYHWLYERSSPLSWRGRGEGQTTS